MYLSKQYKDIYRFIIKKNYKKFVISSGLFRFDFSLTKVTANCVKQISNKNISKWLKMQHNYFVFNLIPDTRFIFRLGDKRYH